MEGERGWRCRWGHDWGSEGWFGHYVRSGGSLVVVVMRVGSFMSTGRENW